MDIPCNDPILYLMCSCRLVAGSESPRYRRGSPQSKTMETNGQRPRLQSHRAFLPLPPSTLGSSSLSLGFSLKSFISGHEQENIETLKSSPVKPSSPKKTEEFIRDLLSDEERADKRQGKASSSRKRHGSEVHRLSNCCGSCANSCVGGE